MNRTPSEHKAGSEQASGWSRGAQDSTAPELPPVEQPEPGRRHQRRLRRPSGLLLSIVLVASLLYVVFVFGVGLASCGGNTPIRAASLVALNARTGAKRWTAKTNAVSLDHPTIQGRYVLVTASFQDATRCLSPPRLLAFDNATGRELKGLPSGSASHARANIHVDALPGQVIAFSRSGSKLWSAKVPYVGTSEGNAVSKESVFVPTEGIARANDCGGD